MTVLSLLEARTPFPRGQRTFPGYIHATFRRLSGLRNSDCRGEMLLLPRVVPQAAPNSGGRRAGKMLPTNEPVHRPYTARKFSIIPQKIKVSSLLKFEPETVTRDCDQGRVKELARNQVTHLTNIKPNEICLIPVKLLPNSSGNYRKANSAV